METVNQLTFTNCTTPLKLKSNAPTKDFFNHIDWSFIHPLAKCKYSALTQIPEGSDPISLIKAHLLIYLGKANSDRKLVEALRYNDQPFYVHYKQTGAISSGCLMSHRRL